MLPPLPRCSGWAYSSLIAPSRVSLPRKGRRVGLHIVLFEACSAFTRVTACTLARPPIRGPLYRRLQPLRYLHDCSGCFRLERLPGGPCTHWKAPPFHGARQNRTSLQYRMSGGLKLPPQPNRFEIGLVANSVRRVPHDHWPHTPRGPIVDRGIGD